MNKLSIVGVVVISVIVLFYFGVSNAGTKNTAVQTQDNVGGPVAFFRCQSAPSTISLVNGTMSYDSESCSYKLVDIQKNVAFFTEEGGSPAIKSKLDFGGKCNNLLTKLTNSVVKEGVTEGIFIGADGNLFYCYGLANT